MMILLTHLSSPMNWLSFNADTGKGEEHRFVSKHQYLQTRFGGEYMVIDGKLLALFVDPRDGMLRFSLDGRIITLDNEATVAYSRRGSHLFLAIRRGEDQIEWSHDQSLTPEEAFVRMYSWADPAMYDLALRTYEIFNDDKRRAEYIRYHLEAGRGCSG